MRNNEQDTPFRIFVILFLFANLLIMTFMITNRDKKIISLKQEIKLLKQENTKNLNPYKHWLKCQLPTAGIKHKIMWKEKTY